MSNVVSGTAQQGMVGSPSADLSSTDVNPSEARQARWVILDGIDLKMAASMWFAGFRSPKKLVRAGVIWG